MSTQVLFTLGVVKTNFNRNLADLKMHTGPPQQEVKQYRFSSAYRMSQMIENNGTCTCDRLGEGGITQLLEGGRRF